MRVIAYKSGYSLPIIDFVDNISDDIDIMGGRFLRDGNLALHIRKIASLGVVDKNNDFVYIVPIGKFPKDFDEAMDQRDKEILKNRYLFGDIAKPAIKKRVENQILHQENSVLWQMMIDPEV